jgi:putative ABC transport system permease protein
LTDLRPGAPLTWVLRIWGRLLPEDVRDEIVEDLLTEYRDRRRERSGWTWAAWCLGRDLLTTDYVGLHVTARRLRSRRTSPGSGWAEEPRTGGRTMSSGKVAWRFELWHALKVLARARGFTALAVATIAIGVGGVTAVSGIVSSILMRPLPYEEAERLVMVWQADPERGNLRINASGPLFRRWRERAGSFSDLAAYRGPGWTMVTDGPTPERVPSVRVTPNFFALLGMTPEVGRGFVPGDATPNAGTNVIVSRSLWERLGRTDDEVGSVVSLDEEPHVVVGVMPAGFEFIERDVDVWYPYEVVSGDSWDQWTLRVVARLAPGVSPEAAGVRVAELQAALTAERPGLDVPPGTAIRSVLDELVGDARAGLWATAGAVAVGLLIALVNVGGLLLSRNLARRPELAMMRALGASRGGILRHIVWQALVLSAAGLTVGLVLAQVLVDAAPRLMQPDLPRAGSLSIDGLGLSVGAVSALLVAIGSGVLSLPWRDSGLRAHTARSRTHGRALSGILVGQTALAVVLLVAGGLLIRSFLGLAGTDPGIDPDGVLAVDLRLPGSLFDDDAVIRSFTAEVDERVALLPGVAAVGQIQRLPFAGGNWNSYVLDPESPVEDDFPEADVRVITPGYPEAIGLPLLRGREFEERDGPDAALVALVNEQLAEQMWPGADPVGRRVVVDMFGDWIVEVVGVVGGVHHHGLAAETRAEILRPLRPGAGAVLELGGPGGHRRAARERDSRRCSRDSAHRNGFSHDANDRAGGRVDRDATDARAGLRRSRPLRPRAGGSGDVRGGVVPRYPGPVRDGAACGARCLVGQAPNGHASAHGPSDAGRTRARARRRSSPVARTGLAPVRTRAHRSDHVRLGRGGPYRIRAGGLAHAGSARCARRSDGDTPGGRLTYGGVERAADETIGSICHGASSSGRQYSPPPPSRSISPASTSSRRSLAVSS